MKLPRKRRVPARIDIGSAEQFQFTDVKSLRLAQFYEAVEKLSATIDWRLDEQSLKPACVLEQLLISATERATDSVEQDELLKSVTEYHPHLDAQKLKTELYCHQNTTLNLILQTSSCGSRKLICGWRLVRLCLQCTSNISRFTNNHSVL